jgi:hypothetical protein
VSDANVWSDDWDLVSVGYVMASTLSSPEVAEYPDLKQITVQARTPSQTGERLWLIHDVEPPAPA